MAIPLTGPVSLGDLKNATGAATASFSDPKIRRRWVSSDGMRYGDQMPANTQMSLGDFRGSILTLERDFDGTTLGRNPVIGLQTVHKVQDNFGVMAGAAIGQQGANPRYRRLSVSATGNYARDVAAGMVSAAYIPPELLPASVTLTIYQISDDNGQRSMLAVNCWSSGFISGNVTQPIWVDPIIGAGTSQLNFRVDAGYPYVTVIPMQVVRSSVSTESTRILDDMQGGNYSQMRVMDLRFR